MIRILKLGLAGLFVICLFWGLIFLPEYAMRREDAQYIDKYNLYERETSEDMLSTLSLEKKLEILSLGEEHINATQILSVYTLENLEKSDKTLLDNLDSNVKKMSSMDIIPVIDGEVSWEKNFDYAELYNLSIPENPGMVLPVWYLVFYNNKDAVNGCSFLIDANTYQVYAASVSGRKVYDYIDCMYKKMEQEGFDYFDWGNYWLSQYGSYLAGKDVDILNVYAETDFICLRGDLCIGNLTYGVMSGVGIERYGITAYDKVEMGEMTFRFCSITSQENFSGNMSVEE